MHAKSYYQLKGMRRAEDIHKVLIVNMLHYSFGDNKRVNYIVKQDSKRGKRLRKLMEYSYEVCFLFGDVFISDDRKASALVVIMRFFLVSSLVTWQFLFRTLEYPWIK